MNPDISPHSARRYLRKLLTQVDVESLSKVKNPVSDRVFGTQLIHSNGVVITRAPTVSTKRKQKLMRAAHVAAQRVKREPKLTKKTVERIERIEKKVAKLEKAKQVLSTNLKELKNKKVKPLETLTDALHQEYTVIKQIQEATESNFTRAQKIVARDERMLKTLRTEVKTALGPNLKANTKDIKLMKQKIAKLETMYAVYEKTGAYDHTRLKEMGERIFQAKQQVKKLQPTKN